MSMSPEGLRTPSSHGAMLLKCNTLSTTSPGKLGPWQKSGCINVPEPGLFYFFPQYQFHFNVLYLMNTVNKILPRVPRERTAPCICPYSAGLSRRCLQAIREFQGNFGDFPGIFSLHLPTSLPVFAYPCISLPVSRLRAVFTATLAIITHT